MHINNFSRTVFFMVLAIVLPGAVLAADWDGLPGAAFSGAPRYLLVQEAGNDVQNGAETQAPPSGTLVLPESMQQNNERQEKCMTVCAEWGEDCTYINRGAGGTTRMCRRTCRRFTEECF
jgi:hypothetical protein